MPRYRARRAPKGYWEDDDAPLIPSLQVDSSAPEDSGVLNHLGDPLYRYPDEIGFLRGLATKQNTER